METLSTKRGQQAAASAIPKARKSGYLADLAEALAAVEAIAGPRFAVMVSIQHWWRFQAEHEQARWESFLSTGIIGEEAAKAWADEVWADFEEGDEDEWEEDEDQDEDSDEASEEEAPEGAE